MSYGSEAVKRWRKRTKQRIVDYLGGQCCICGYNRCLESLAVHHIDPAEKEFNLQSVCRNPGSWDRIENELKKCCLLCSNCHGEVHAGVTALRL
jgi:hypothetical protein